MKKLVLMLAIAGMAFTACNKKNTPPEETAAAETTEQADPDMEEMRRQKMAAMEF